MTAFVGMLFFTPVDRYVGKAALAFIAGDQNSQVLLEDVCAD